MTKKTTRKRAAKPKAKAEEPQVAPPETEGTIFEVPTTEPHVAFPFEAKASGPVPADGSLIRQDGTPVVYVMQGGKKRPILDGAAMDSCGFGWNEIAVLPYEVVAPIPVGEIVTRPKDLQGA